MAIHRLSAIEVKTKTKPGRYCDGRGLWLYISKSGSKSWVLRYTLQGNSREMGLGSAHSVSLKDARKKAERCHSLMADGLDPLEEKRRSRADKRQRKTFKECAKAYLTAFHSKWSSEKHRKQWKSSLRTYALPFIGDLPVDEIITDDIEKLLLPIWASKNETASRVRGRIENILAWATVKKLRIGENPARWKSNLDKLLPPVSAVKKVRHFPAMPSADLPDFIDKLHQKESVSARALEFTILTAARTGETINATWDEIDLEAKTWTVPTERMKARKAHVVPLSARAIDILREMKEIGSSEWVFPSGNSKKPLSNMAMLNLLKRMKIQNATVHGFRSTFRDWVADSDKYDGMAAEHALAHQLPNKVEASYQRSTMFEKRRRLMDGWASFAAPSTANKQS